MEKEYLKFWPEYEPNHTIEEDEGVFIYHQGKLIARQRKGETDREIQIPTFKEVKELIKCKEALWHLGMWEGKQYFAYLLLEMQEVVPCLEKQGLEWITYDDTRWQYQIEWHGVAIKAKQLLTWDASTQYCGQCGHKYERKKDERAKYCPNCKGVQYPRISPAIIVGITRGDQILLAHNRNFKEGLYSIIAGFVEQGETFEEAVKREVFEEVGLKVKNIRYVQSRPWISMDSLMIGFMAEYEAGEIKVDGVEIVDAGWYQKGYLPPVLPEKLTTARYIIDKILKISS